MTGRAEAALRRATDITVASGALIALSPVLAAIAVAVKIDSPGPAIFRQQRIGRHGRPFTLYKFRTMHAGTTGPAVTSRGDTRVTRLGRRLRATKLDELPQLVNVARGDMSLVGPRPEVPEYVALWAEADRHIILSVRPGITDPETYRLRREESLLASQADPETYYVENLLPSKVASYARYVRHRTARDDLRVFARSVGVLVGR